MKKLLLIVLAVVLGAGVVSAQPKSNKKKTETVKFTTDLDCESCANKVLNVIPFKKGVKDCVVDVAAKTVEVTFDPRKTDAEKLTEELNKIDVHVVSPDSCAGECESEHGDCTGHDHNHEGHSHAH